MLTVRFLDEARRSHGKIFDDSTRRVDTRILIGYCYTNKASRASACKRTREAIFSRFIVKQFFKHPASIGDQISSLSQHGVIIDSEKDLARWLECVSYFRLRGYTFSFEDMNGRHRIIRSISQGELADRYDFDRRLRFILISGIDHVEILMRTQLGLQMVAMDGANWYENPKLFRDPDKYRNDLRNIDRETARASELFLTNFFSSHASGERPPSWMVLEVLSFGTVSKLFENLTPGLQGKKAISQRLGFRSGGSDYLGSWIKSLVTVRNHCAHHARIINRNFVHVPRYAHTIRDQAWHSRWLDARRIYTMLTMIAVMLEPIPGGQRWKRETVELLQACPGIEPDEIGIPHNWETEPLWNRP